MEKRSRQFRLLLIREDGTRLFRLTIPQWMAVVSLAGAALGLTLLATSLGSLYRDYRALRDQRATLSVLLARAAEQQAALDAYRQRARELREEVASWRRIHARILEPFGPDAGLAKRGAGIGGRAERSSGRESQAEDARDELASLARLIKDEGQHLRGLEQFFSRAGKVLASLPSRWPIRGPVNSNFGARTSPWFRGREFHSGIDIGAPVGTPVHAPAPGTVVFAGTLPDYGLTLILDHGNDTRSLYAHLSRIRVAERQQVERGDRIALTGNTGRSSGPHLHYEIQVQGRAVDPTLYLWESTPPGPSVASR